MKDDRWRVFLDTEEYRTLLESAYQPTRKTRTTRQVRLEIRLMACSLRVDTVSGLTYGQFEQRETPEGDKWVVNVEAKDSTEREAETRPRSVYVPNDIMDEVKAYAKRRSRTGDGDLLFPHTTRTIQRDVTRSAKNAATATGDEDHLKVSSHDLRRYFATHLLFRHEVQSAVVRGLGGWKSDEAMFEYLVLPDDVLFSRLGEAGLLGTSYDKLSQRNLSEKLAATATRLADLAETADRKDLVEVGEGEMQDVFAGVDEITVNVGTSTPEEKKSKTPDPPKQHSLQQFGRASDGTVSPTAAVKVTYLTWLVIASWLVSFPPVF